ncbi:group II intron maturase-specific domain-containing protein, partial [Algivirga pacifica]|uniref:group II intron maturase-specific domain-containing protein n=1 Tax=Algivirga pacifica TaxID=1162670 RepID=UPI0031F197D7
LMNIYLDDFDQYMKSKGHRIVRYADDILLLGSSKSEAWQLLQVATHYLEKELLLTVNQAKTHVTHLSEGIPYLGVEIHERGIFLSKKSIRSFKDKIRVLTPRYKGAKLTDHVHEINKSLRGFMNYFRVTCNRLVFQDLMGWVRRRLRMMKLVEWKSWKGLHRQLRRMGYKKSFERVDVKKWRMSKAHLAHMALPNKWFTEELKLFDMTKVEVNTLHQYYE